MRYPITGAMVALSLAFAALPASAAIVYVDKFSPGPAHDGKSWATGYTTIVSGYAAAKAGDEVWVGPGTYTEAITMKPNVSLYGGFIGYEMFRDQRIGVQDLTTLSAPQASIWQVQAGPDITSLTTLDGFTIRAGAAGSVGGLYCNGGSPTVSHNVFIANSANGGRAIFCTRNSLAVIRNNIVVANGAPEQLGTAIGLSSASPFILNNTIAGNSGYGISGSGTPTVVNNIVAFNYYGISIKSPSGLFTLRNNCVFGNIAANYYQMPKVQYTGIDGNISDDPRFSVYGYGNLHVSPDSPCREAGDDTAVPPGDTDIDLQPRIQGAHVDIGADESDGRVWTFQPRIVRVSPNGNDSNDGSSWAVAKKSLQAAIDLASTLGGNVWAKTGTYVLTPNGRFPLLTMRPFCYLYGGFAGTETALSQRDWNANPTFITSTLTSAMIGAGTGHYVSALDGFIVGPSSTVINTGGGIVCNSASPSIRNNVFMRNTLSAVSSSYANPLVSNNAFYANYTSSSAGAVTCLTGSITVTGNVFGGNGPSTSTQSLGTVVLGQGTTSAVLDNLFYDNSAGSSAGVSGVGAKSVFSAVIANNTFVNNRGIAVLAVGKTMVVNNIFASNDSSIMQASSLNVRNNGFFNNSQGKTDPTFIGRNGNIGDYPLFEDLFREDYHLSAASPCIDAGDDTFVTAGDVDLDGLPRSQGRSVDMGCYESSATSLFAHWADILRALKIAGGLQLATIEDLAIIAPTKVPPGLELVDAEALIRRLAK